MTVHVSQIEVEELATLDRGLGGPLRDAFASNEIINPQFGLDWFHLIASSALENHEKAVLFVARLSQGDFIALPLKLNSRNGLAESLGNFYTSAYSPVVRTESPELLYTALFRHIAERAGITAIILSPLMHDPCQSDLVRKALARSGWTGVHRFFCFANWTLDTQDLSSESYLAGRPSRLRNTIARRTRQFLEDGRGSLGIIRGGDAIKESIGQYTCVYDNSWKRPEPFPSFIPGLIRLAAKRGWLRLGVASYDNIPVASQIWLVFGGKAYIFKLAHREDYKHLSPGTVLTAFMIEHVLDEDSVASIDFLSGDDAFKESWMSARRECFGIAAYNPATVRGRIMLYWYALKRVVKKFSRVR